MVSMKKRPKVTKKLALSGGKMKESRVGLALLILVLFPFAWAKVSDILPTHKGWGFLNLTGREKIPHNALAGLR